MDTQPNFEYLCRVCAANTKGKNSVAECVYILKTPSLKDKIEKYLYLSISENDVLPKVLCKTCFRQVEATASLSKIAKHTQKVFRDFLFSTTFQQKPRAVDVSQEHLNATEYTPLALTAKEVERPLPLATIEIAPPPPPAPSQPPPPPPTPLPPSHKDEVVVNVSVTDPLTRETQQKMISSASQKRQNSSDTRFTPKSIAQRAFTSTPKSAESSITCSAKKSSPPGVINFFHGMPQQTTYSSGGYVIGRAEPPTVSRTPPEASPVVQPKRKSVKTTLGNNRPTNTGQVSLLKVSQKPVVAAPRSKSPTPPKPSSPPQKKEQPKEQQKEQTKAISILNATDVEEELPQQIIIAAAKKRKHHVKEKQKTAEPEKESSPSAAVEKPPQPKTSAGIPDDIALGKVIKDIDLLKLILKALKWPVNEQTLDLQMMRLKNSKFAEIMCDPNLLQDTDLTQIMGPYLAPVLLAAQAFQQQQLAAVAAAQAASNLAAKQSSSDIQPVAVELASAINYKLPAETSVQLVPASTEDDDTDTNTTKAGTSAESLKRGIRANQKSAPPKKMRKTTPVKNRVSSSIVISDEEDDTNTNAPASTTNARRSSKSSQNFHVDIDAAILSQFGLQTAAGAGDSANNNALLALVQRQRAALSRMQRVQRRRNTSNSNIITVPASGGGFDLDFDDDIVLMEPNSNAVESSTLLMTDLDGTSTATQASAGFIMPPQVPMPLITRPIIKRRKTVIQTARTDLTTNDQSNKRVTKTSAADTSTSPKAIAQLPPMPPLQKKPSEVHANGTQFPLVAALIPATMASENLSPSKVTATNVTCTNTATTTTSASSSSDTLPLKPKKSTNTKSALGQQLLEAIGLQKVPSSSKSQAVEASSSRQSIQQIRSALKRSLKQAQDKQLRRKHEEPIKQDADSTTKSVVKEVLVEAKSKHTPNSGIAVDVEDQIDKISLQKIVTKQVEVKPQQPQEEADRSLLVAKIPDSRRKTQGSNKNRASTSLLIDRKKDNLELNTIVEVKEDSETVLPQKDLMKSDKDDNESPNLSLSTSTGAFLNSEEVIKETTPRKRGRKSKAEKEAEAKLKEDNKANENENVGSLTLDQEERSCSAVSLRRSALDDPDYEGNDGAVSLKNDDDNANTSTSSRPSRVSKTLSKYYKGPDKKTPSRRSVPTRSTRNRN